MHNEFIVIKESDIHNKGVFAAKDIPKGTKIIEYIGKKITHEEADIIEKQQIAIAEQKFEEGRIYLFELDDDFMIDGNVPENDAKYINHTCNPNCEVEIEQGRIWIIALRDINKGEELGYNYGFDLVDAMNHPCECGSPNCVKYILAEEHWPELKKLREDKLIVIKESKIHNKGVFAAKDIPKGTKIIEYLGEKVTKEESDKRADEQLARAEKDHSEGLVYIFELNDEFDIDGNVPYNDAKWINHSCNPNCDIDNDGEHIWVVAKKDIKKGEELFYNYGYDPEDFEDHPCRCGSENCVGYIVDEDHWDLIKKKLAEKNMEKK